MSSPNAENAARDVSALVGKGKAVVFKDILLKNGYSEETAATPNRVRNTKSYKKAMEPFVARLERERERQLKALEGKVLETEEYKTLIDAVDKTTKNIQLLGGRPTEISELTIADVKKRLANLK